MCDVDHPPPSGTEVKNEQSYNSTHPTCLQDMGRDFFYLYVLRFLWWWLCGLPSSSIDATQSGSLSPMFQTEKLPLSSENKNKHFFQPGNWCGRSLWNVGNKLPHYAVSQPRRQKSSWSGLVLFIVVSCTHLGLHKFPHL